MTLTPVGERLFELTQQHFAIAEQAEQLLSASGTLAGGFVRIGADGPHHVMPVVAKFTQLYPELEVSLQMGNAGAVLQRLAEARLDVAIVGRKSPDTRFHFEVFRQSPIVCFAAIQHPLSQRDSVALTDIVKHKMILREPASETRQLFERALRALEELRVRPLLTHLLRQRALRASHGSQTLATTTPCASPGRQHA